MKSVNSKREEGAARNAAWRALSPVQQLTSLDARLGKGVGATRQRGILSNRIADAAAPKPATTETADTPVASKAEGRRRNAFKKGKAK